MFNKLFSQFKEKLTMKLGMIGLAVIVAAGLGYGGFKIYEEKIKIVPEELLAETLAKTLAATSYTYGVALEMTTNGEKRNLTDITGIKASETDFYIKGEMYETPVEIYQFADSTYQKDAVSGKWMVFPTSVTDMELMMTEINPMVNFDFNQISAVTYVGVEKIDKKKKYIIKLTPQINNKFLEIYWEDFQYTLWVDKKSRYISQGIITATNKKNPKNTLSLVITLGDFNKKLTLKKPE